MLSSDVVNLYKVVTRRINEVIKRNISRFPEPFCFQLNNEKKLWFQSGATNNMVRTKMMNYLQGHNL